MACHNGRERQRPGNSAGTANREEGSYPGKHQVTGGSEPLLPPRAAGAFTRNRCRRAQLGMREDL